jgi:hypothetical protein
MRLGGDGKSWELNLWDRELAQAAVKSVGKNSGEDVPTRTYSWVIRTGADRQGSDRHGREL